MFLQARPDANLLDFTQFFGKWLWRCFFVCAIFIPASTVSGSVASQQLDDHDWWQQAKDKVDAITGSGKLDLYFSGYARHGRHTYAPERLNELNEKAWGAGAGKSVRNIKGHEESLYLFGISDSHFQPQLMVGYAYQWIWPTGQSGIEAGAGFTTMLVSRADYFGCFPFPVVLPVGSIGTQRTKLLAAYVPRLSQHKGNGDVLLIFVRIELD